MWMIAIYPLSINTKSVNIFFKKWGAWWYQAPRRPEFTVYLLYICQEVLDTWNVYHLICMIILLNINLQMTMLNSGSLGSELVS